MLLCPQLHQKHTQSAANPHSFSTLCWTTLTTVHLQSIVGQLLFPCKMHLDTNTLTMLVLMVLKTWFDKICITIIIEIQSINLGTTSSYLDLHTYKKEVK